jgi:hypothetical protein
MLKKVLLVAAGLVALGVVGAVAWIGPRFIIGIIRYGHREEGTLTVGDRAPDARVVSLDGKSQVNLLERDGSKPIVLIFGSFT